jgi:hypothetical protein
VPGDNCRTLTKGAAMGEMFEMCEIGEEQDDDDQDTDNSDLLTQA